MIRVGITGGIGSGKSWICQVFARLGIPVYNADTAARLITENDRAIRKELINLLGNDVYTGKSLNRSRMAEIIFNNRELLKKVNHIIHPAVVIDFRNWCNAMAGFPYIVQESAILFESELYRMFDFIVLVTAPEEVRFRRVINRYGMTAEKINSIMKNQLPEKEISVRSHLVIKNDDKTLVLPPILKFHTEMMHNRKITATG
jgi:dephospho-CoA kinase